MKNVWISDANIFIDLISCGLSPQFFALPWEIKTTELVLNEINGFHDKVLINFFRLLAVSCG